jgi:hypothetical protein
MPGKISVLTDEFGEGDFEKVAAWLASQGFEHVELRGVLVNDNKDVIEKMIPI